MKRETITLDARAQHRIYVLNHVLTGELSSAEAAAYLDLSIRQVRRLLRRYRSSDGAAGLVHGTFTLAGRSLMAVGQATRPGHAQIVTIQQRLDDSLWVELGGGFVPAIPAPPRPAVLRTMPPSGPTPTIPPRSPAPRDHPWRRYPTVPPR